MSFAFEQPVGATSIPIELVLNDGGGGVTGDSPFFALRRATDNYYLDFADNKFKASGWTTKTQPLSGRGDGRYSYKWDSSKSVTTATTIIVEYTNDTAGSDALGVDNDLIIFSRSATILGSIAKSPLANVGAGPGNCKFIYTLTIAGSATKIENAIVYVTTDIGGSNIIAGPTTTDENGQVEFYLDPGTYYFWRNKGGIIFSNPDVESF